jgi:translation initiation factor 1
MYEKVYFCSNQTMKKKKRIDIVYSTNPDYVYRYDEEEAQDTLPPDKQDLRILLDRKNRKGKAVTLVSGFVGNDADRNTLAKQLKNACGVGGSVKDLDILVQGDQRKKVSEFLLNKGYPFKLSGG